MHKELYFRLFGFLPICFFLAHLRYHFLYSTPQNMLWMCNISNLTLAIGIFFNIRSLIRVAFLWAIPALPLWAADMIVIGDYPVSTFLSHIGGFTVGLVAMFRVRADRFSWLYAWIYGLILQQICRLFTSPDLNINVAFRPYLGWERIIDAYWKWWLFTAVMSAAALWLLGQILLRLFPPKNFAAAKI